MLPRFLVFRKNFHLYADCISSIRKLQETREEAQFFLHRSLVRSKARQIQLFLRQKRAEKHSKRPKLQVEGKIQVCLMPRAPKSAGAVCARTVITSHQVRISFL